jgi:hypothetical protein
MRKLILLLITYFAVATQSVFAQVEMADTLRSNGKIYVIVGIILLVLAGFIAYLLIIDKKLKKLEKMLEDRQRQVK